MLCANRIVTILMPGSASARRLIKTSKEKKLFFDLTSGRTTKALILLDDDKLIGCALTPRTIAMRIQTNDSDELNEGENEHDHHQPVSEAAVA